MQDAGNIFAFSFPFFGFQMIRTAKIPDVPETGAQPQPGISGTNNGNSTPQSISRGQSPAPGRGNSSASLTRDHASGYEAQRKDR